MASIKERLTAKVDQVRERRPFVDHLFKMVVHYGTVNGNAQAGAVTFFGFLSFFPILALAFFVIGYVSKVYPDAQGQLVDALEKVLPGVVGEDKGEISMSTFEEYAGAIGVVGLVGVLYSGLGWLSGMRDACEVMFKLPKKEQPNFVIGKARDLLMLAVIGLILIVSVAMSGAISGFSKQILGWVSLDESLLAEALLWVLAHGLAIAATTVLFVVMFELLAQPHVSRRALVDGAVLGAVGFELLKSLANFLIGQTKGQPAFQAFGVALILVVWINYFSRLVMYAAAWAHTSRDAEARREGAESAGTSTATAAPDAVSPVPPVAPELDPAVSTHRAEPSSDGPRKLLVAAGAAAGVAAVGALALKKHRADG